MDTAMANQKNMEIRKNPLFPASQEREEFELIAIAKDFFNV
jgi:hypothetical protein